MRAHKSKRLHQIQWTYSEAGQGYFSEKPCRLLREFEPNLWYCYRELKLDDGTLPIIGIGKDARAAVGKLLSTERRLARELTDPTEPSWCKKVLEASLLATTRRPKQA